MPPPTPSPNLSYSATAAPPLNASSAPTNASGGLLLQEALKLTGPHWGLGLVFYTISTCALFFALWTIRHAYRNYAKLTPLGQVIAWRREVHWKVGWLVLHYFGVALTVWACVAFAVDEEKRVKVSEGFAISFYVLSAVGTVAGVVEIVFELLLVRTLVLESSQETTAFVRVFAHTRYLAIATATTVILKHLPLAGMSSAFCFAHRNDGEGAFAIVYASTAWSILQAGLKWPKALHGAKIAFMYLRRRAKCEPASEVRCHRPSEAMSTERAQALSGCAETFAFLAMERRVTAHEVVAHVSPTLRFLSSMFKPRSAAEVANAAHAVRNVQQQQQQQQPQQQQQVPVRPVGQLLQRGRQLLRRTSSHRSQLSPAEAAADAPRGMPRHFTSGSTVSFDDASSMEGIPSEFAPEPGAYINPLGGASSGGKTWNGPQTKPSPLGSPSGRRAATEV